MSAVLPPSWDAFLDRPFSRPPFDALLRQAMLLAQTGRVYPPREDWFTAFALTAPERVRVVILGQDPYHGEGQANGLAFSVRAGVPLPPSLKNIFRELQDDLHVPYRTNGDLSDWARQGVLLLNTVLTVGANEANSHKRLGWQRFTADVVQSLSMLNQPLVFLLWGAQAQSFAPVISRSAAPRELLAAPHPSPLSVYRGFSGSKPFSRANDFLLRHGQPPIEWVEAPVAE